MAKELQPFVDDRSLIQPGTNTLFVLPDDGDEGERARLAQGKRVERVLCVMHFELSYEAGTSAQSRFSHVRLKIDHPDMYLVAPKGDAG